ncbi:N-formylglutamate amidohydrolase [Tropicimonas sp.]|uniref:N-formylglutamate amidohydrolase n=1 Tax=Tropicimonas sp. TaxID=2067044 RepID=UPI003A846089
METADDSPLLRPDEGPAVRVYNPRGESPVALVCEHASRFIPAALGDLGLDAEGLVSHAAWDIGAMDLALDLMAELDAPLVASRVSRLVYDCNRPPGAPDAIPERSERFGIPGNRALSARDARRRVTAIYHPFRAALERVLGAHRRPAVLVTIHSFTPVYNGQRRTVELGLLHDGDARLAKRMLAEAPHRVSMRTALNEPYAMRDGVTHTLREHGVATGLPNVMIEVRNDLIDSPAGVRRVAGELAALVRAGAGGDGAAPVAYERQESEG